jgi:hypothetical protein
MTNLKKPLIGHGGVNKELHYATQLHALLLSHNLYSLGHSVALLWTPIELAKITLRLVVFALSLNAHIAGAPS